MSLVVDTTAPVLYFSGVFNYKGKDQAVLTFEFEEFKFRIWDYINPEVFTPDTIQFRLTTSVYNPAIFMPTLVSVDFDINIPPVGC